MTSETRTFIHLYDIVAVQLECNKCGTILSRKLNEASGLVKQCPSCQTTWMQENTSEEKRVRLLATIIQEAMQALEGRNFALTLEVRGLSR